ncbi:hypothetical protein ABPG72_018696 [Tetrahymena utriculariae]
MSLKKETYQHNSVIRYKILIILTIHTHTITYRFNNKLFQIRKPQKISFMNQHLQVFLCKIWNNNLQTLLCHSIKKKNRITHLKNQIFMSQIINFYTADIYFWFIIYRFKQTMLESGHNIQQYKVVMSQIFKKYFQKISLKYLKICFCMLYYFRHEKIINEQILLKNIYKAIQFQY